MSTARNGAVEIYYEAFGDPHSPTLLLVNGLGSQCLNYAEEWCQLFCDEGFHVVRFDNRDVGLSTKLEGTEYVLADMARDAVAVLDAVGVDKAHVMGCSMGGMIVQRLVLDHPAPRALHDLGDVTNRRGGVRREFGGSVGVPPRASGSHSGRLHRTPGRRPSCLRIEARVARR